MFKTLYIKYLKRLLLFTTAVLAVFILFHYCWDYLLSPFCLQLIVLFLLIMAGTHAVVLHTDARRLEYAPDPDTDAETRKKDIMEIEKQFIRRYMVATTVKWLLFVLLLIVYAVTKRADMLRFGLNFVVLYVAYSVFEILILKKPLLK